MRSATGMFRTLLLTAAIAAPVTLQAQLSEGFDNITTLSDWYFQNNSDPVGVTSWFQGNEDVFPAYNGADNSYIGANFNNTDGIGTISNWMLTPEVSLVDGAVFSFFTRASTGGGVFPDRLELRLSTSGQSTEVGNLATSVGDFGTLLLSVNPDLTQTGYPEDWTEYSVTLAGMGAAASGRFAFRYFVESGGPDGNNSNYIGIDAVSYSAVNVVPEPSSLLLIGAGLFALGFARRRRVS